MAKKKYPKWATTITPLSKFLAMVLFILLPFLGLYLGMEYQKALDHVIPGNISLLEISPNKLIVTRLDNRAFKLTPFTKTITDEKIIRELYSNFDAFKLLPPNTRMGCPMIPAGYQPINYILDFYKDNTLKRHIIFTPGGCRDSIKLENNEMRLGVTKTSIDFTNTLRHALNLSAKEFRGYGKD